MSTTKRQDAIRPKLRRPPGRGRGSTAAAIGAVIAVGATCFTTTAASGASKRSTSKPTTNAPTISTTLPPPSTKAADLRATEPIRIVVTYAETVNFSPGTRSAFRAAQARAAAQNEGGGIKGRNVEVIGCNTKLDEATSEACARQAVLLKADAFIAGQAISLPANGNPQGVPDAPHTLPVMQQAGVAWFG